MITNYHKQYKKELYLKLKSKPTYNPQCFDNFLSSFMEARRGFAGTDETSTEMEEGG